MDDVANMEPSERVVELAAPRSAGGEGAMLRQLAGRFRRNQKAANDIMDKEHGTEPGRWAEQRAWCWKIAADYCEHAFTFIEATVPDSQDARNADDR